MLKQYVVHEEVGSYGMCTIYLFLDNRFQFGISVNPADLPNIRDQRNWDGWVEVDKARVVTLKGATRLIEDITGESVMTDAKRTHRPFVPMQYGSGRMN